MVTNDIDRLLARYFAGEFIPQDEIRLDSWLNESEENEKYFFELTSLYQNIAGTQHSHFDIQGAFEKFSKHLERADIEEKTPAGKRNKILLWTLSTAAAAIVGLLIIFNYETTYTTITEQSTHTLANNTEVNLTEGEIRLDKNPANDTIYLKGAAHFSMESEKEGSKIVKAGKVYVKDIGTQFTVDAKDVDSVYVSVTEGEVQFYSDNNSGVNLRVKESGYYLSRTNKFHKIVPKGNFNFTATSLDEVVSQLTLFYGQPIKLEEENLKELSINANFREEELSTVLEVLSVALNVRISYVNHEYVVEKL